MKYIGYFIMALASIIALCEFWNEYEFYKIAMKYTVEGKLK